MISERLFDAHIQKVREAEDELWQRAIREGMPTSTVASGIAEIRRRAMMEMSAICDDIDPPRPGG